MGTTPLVLVGAGGHASDTFELIQRINRSGTAREPSYEVLGAIADSQPIVDRLGTRGVAFLGDARAYPPVAQYVLGIGYPEARRDVAERLEGREPCAPLLDPTAAVSSVATVGSGSCIFWHAGLSPLARLGDHSFVSYGATVGHDTLVGNFVSIMPGARISGDVRIGDGVMIGSGAVVLEGRAIGTNAKVGSGAVVTQDVPPGATVVGVPAR